MVRFTDRVINRTYTQDGDKHIYTWNYLVGLDSQDIQFYTDIEPKHIQSIKITAKHKDMDRAKIPEILHPYCDIVLVSVSHNCVPEYMDAYPLGYSERSVRAHERAIGPGLCDYRHVITITTRVPVDDCRVYTGMRNCNSTWKSHVVTNSSPWTEPQCTTMFILDESASVEIYVTGEDESLYISTSLGKNLPSYEDRKHFGVKSINMIGIESCAVIDRHELCEHVYRNLVLYYPEGEDIASIIDSLKFKPLFMAQYRLTDEVCPILLENILQAQCYYICPLCNNHIGADALDRWVLVSNDVEPCCPVCTNTLYNTKLYCNDEGEGDMLRVFDADAPDDAPGEGALPPYEVERADAKRKAWWKTFRSVCEFSGLFILLVTVGWGYVKVLNRFF